MRKIAYWTILVVLVAISLVSWQLPNILQAMPSRYVARLPGPMQQIGREDIVRVLPTAAPGEIDTTALLAPPVAAAAEPTAAPLPTMTALPVVTTDVASDVAEAVAIPPTPTGVPTATPAPQTPLTELPGAARLEGVNHQLQGWNNCGPATLAMTLSYFDLAFDQAETAAFLKPNVEDRNVNPSEMALFVNEMTTYRAVDRANGDLDTLRAFLANGIPVIVEIGIDPPGDYAWLEWYGHYLLVVAYDDAAQTFFVYDSWLGTGVEPADTTSKEGRVWTYEELDTYWRHFNRSYIALYAPEQAAVVENIIGENMDDAVMWQNALARTQAELEATPDDAFLWFNLGTVYNTLGQFDLAAAAYDKARDIGLPRRMLWYQFGAYSAYYETGRYDEVVLLADVALDKPYLEEVLYYRGLAKAALGRVAEARDDLSASAAFNPRFTQARDALRALDSSG